jgi:hypothetical protein
VRRRGGSIEGIRREEITRRGTREDKAEMEKNNLNKVEEREDETRLEGKEEESKRMKING